MTTASVASGLLTIPIGGLVNWIFGKVASSAYWNVQASSTARGADAGQRLPPGKA